MRESHIFFYHRGNLTGTALTCKYCFQMKKGRLIYLFALQNFCTSNLTGGFKTCLNEICLKPPVTAANKQNVTFQ